MCLSPAAPRVGNQENYLKRLAVKTLDANGLLTGSQWRSMTDFWVVRLGRVGGMPKRKRKEGAVKIKFKV